MSGTPKFSSIRANSFNIIASSSSGLASTRMRQEISMSERGSIFNSTLHPSRKAIGDSNSIICLDPGSISGMAYLLNTSRTDLCYLIMTSDIRIKQSSAMSSIYSSSIGRLPANSPPLILEDLAEAELRSATRSFELM